LFPNQKNLDEKSTEALRKRALLLPASEVDPTLRHGNVAAQFPFVSIVAFPENAC
jgi:hypothetical protein